MKNFTIKTNLESYASIYLDYNGNETDRICRMTKKQAHYLAKMHDAYVVELHD